MKRSSAVRAVAVAPPVEPRSAGGGEDGPGAVEALRRRLASGTAREHVVLDFLEDDLREARAALAGVAAWIAGVERALADPDASQQRILSAANAGATAERLDELSEAVASVRRRVVQVAARM
jgi:hypothetical protein